MQTFNKHIIQKNETLKSIATLYDLQEEDLIMFHNNHSTAKENILIGITSQKELFLPRNVVLDKKRLVKFGNGNKLFFEPGNSFYKYGVSITIENGDKKNELKYDTSVKWLKTENKLHYFEIDRTSKIFINEEEVNDIADLLAYKTSQVLYPLEISVDEAQKKEFSSAYAKIPGKWHELFDKLNRVRVAKGLNDIIVGSDDGYDEQFKRDKGYVPPKTK